MVWRPELHQDRVVRVALRDRRSPCLPLGIEKPQVVDDVDELVSGQDLGPQAGEPARLCNVVTSISRWLNALYSTGRYAICSATTTSPVTAARKSTTVAPGNGRDAKPRVNNDEPLSRSASDNVPSATSHMMSA